MPIDWKYLKLVVWMHFESEVEMKGWAEAKDRVWLTQKWPL